MKYVINIYLKKTLAYYVFKVPHTSVGMIDRLIGKD